MNQVVAISGNASFCKFIALLWQRLVLFVFLVATCATGHVADGQSNSIWDEDLLKMQLHDVTVKPNFMLNPNPMLNAWQEIGRHYLLRCNIYFEGTASSPDAIFSFHSASTTGKELLEAFLTTYSEYTYTQDQQTGVIWVHPKRIEFRDILSQKVRVAKTALQVSMYQDIFAPLKRILAPEKIAGNPLGDGGWAYNTFGFCLDLPAGEYSVRDLLDYCCVANPNLVFALTPGWSGVQAPKMCLDIANLNYDNPMAPPRNGAIRYWEIEVGKTTNGAPSPDEVEEALADPNPRIRTAAVRYLGLTSANYDKGALIKPDIINPDSLRRSAWAAFEMKYLLEPGMGDYPGIIGTKWPMMALTNNLAQVDPGLALLISMEVAREKKDASILDAFASHKFSEAEIAVIKHDLYRIARASKLVRDKLIELKFDAPELSAAALRELENTNLFTLAPRDKN
jgi:hypothetical protein